VPANHSPFIACSSVALLGGALLVAFTPWGLGLSPDSAVYIGAARSLLLGEGYSLPAQSGAFVPVIHYPPLYPLLLAAIGIGGTDPLEAAKWFGALLFAINIFVVGWLIFTDTKSILLSVWACLLIATALPIVQVHSMVWSEPVFILFESAAVLFLMSYFRTANCRCLIAAASAAGLGAITRYAGAAFIASGVASILWLSNGSREKRLLHAGAFLAIAFLPLVGWMARNWVLTGSSANRNVSFHPIGSEHLTAVLTTLMSSVLPSWLVAGNEHVAVGVILFALGAFLFSLWRYRQRHKAGLAAAVISGAFPGLLLLMILSYLSILFATISFLDHQTPIDGRILAPLQVLIVLLGISVAAILPDLRINRKGSLAFVLPFVFILLALQLASTWPWVALTYEKGVGYASREWRESDFMKKVNLIPPRTPIFSNAPDVLYTLLGRSSEMIPRKTNPDTRAPNENYNAQLLKMKNLLKTNQGLLVYFDRVQWRWYLPSPADLEGELGLRLLVREKDGMIYQIN